MPPKKSIPSRIRKGKVQARLISADNTVTVNNYLLKPYWKLLVIRIIKGLNVGN